MQLKKNQIIIGIFLLSILILLYSARFSYASIDLSSEDEKDEDQAEFTLLDWIDKTIRSLSFIDGILIGAGAVGLFLMIIILIWRYGEFPIVIVQSRKKYDAKKLGRFIDEERSNHLPDYWKLKFKSQEKGVKEYYCTENFEEMKTFNFNRWYIIYNELPHYISTKLRLDESEQFPKQKRKKGVFNTFKYVIYRICCVFIWNKYIIKQLYNSIEFEDTDKMVKEVHLLQLEYLMNEITIVCTITYKKKDIDRKLGEIELPIIEENVPVYRIDDLKRNSKVIKDSIEISDYKPIVNKIFDFKDAINKRKSINEIRSIMELKLRLSNKEFVELNQYTNQIRESLRISERKVFSRVQDAVEKITKDSFYSPEDLAEYTSKILAPVNAGAKIGDAINTGLKEYLREKDAKKYGELSILSERLITENKELRDQVNYLREMNMDKISGISPIKIKLQDNIEDK